MDTMPRSRSGSLPGSCYAGELNCNLLCSTLALLTAPTCWPPMLHFPQQREGGGDVADEGKQA